MSKLNRQNYCKEIHILHEYFRLNTEVILKKQHLNYGAYIILNCIFDDQEITQYKISKVSGFSIQRTHQLVNLLEERELITKVNVSKYKKHLYLTKKGEQVVEQTEQVLMKQFEEVFGDHKALTSELIGSIKAFNKLANSLPVDKEP